MPIIKKHKFHTSFVRTPEEKKLRKVERELKEVKEQLAALTSTSGETTKKGTRKNNKVRSITSSKE